MTVRYGIIGAGMMAQEHIRNISLLEDTAVAAIADPNEEMRQRSEKLAGGRVQSFAHSLELLSADLCDAYVIASPNDTHCQILLDVLPGNKPVLVEKPLCTTVDDCRRVIASAHGRTAPVWVAMEYRYMPPLERFMRELASGIIGKTIMVSVREHRFPFLDKVNNWNRFNARTGGTLVEKCCHFWDLMSLAVGDEPVRVFASAAIDVNHLDERHSGMTPDIIDNGFVIVEFDEGARGMLDLCMFGEGSYWQEVVSAVGPKGRIEAKIPGPARFLPTGEERIPQIEISHRCTKETEVDTVEVDPEILRAGDHYGGTFFQHQKFLELVRSGEGKPEVSLQDGFRSVAVGEAAELSARIGMSVEVARL